VANNFYKDKQGRYPIKSIGIEDVDQAVVDYFDKKIAMTVEVERGRKKVPVVFASGERWKMIRDHRGLRDDNGTLILPLMTVRRTNIDRTRGFGGLAQETPFITISQNIHSKTGNLQNILNLRKRSGFLGVPKKDKVVREYITLPFPDFATIFYEISIWTQYQTQMNEILEKIFHNYDWHNSFVMPVDYDGKEPKGNGYYFVGFRDGDIVSQSNFEEFTDQERIIKYSYGIKTPVYFMFDLKDETLSYGKDEDRRKIVFKQQNAVNIKLKEEVISLEEFEKLFS